MHLAQWIPYHYQWIWSMGYGFLGQHKISVMDYLQGFVKGFKEIDELRLLIFTRMCHVQIAVICRDVIWSTSHYQQTELTKYDIILAYCGGTTYAQTTYLQPVMVNVDIYFLGETGNEYVIKPCGEMEVVGSN